MTDPTGSEHVDTLVIGGGQAGLAVGYHLSQRGLPYAIVDANDRIGDAWRNRWDSLRLFTPKRLDALPGMPFPGYHWASRARTRWPTIWSPTPAASIFASRTV